MYDVKPESSDVKPETSEVKPDTLDVTYCLRSTGMLG